MKPSFSAASPARNVIFALSLFGLLAGTALGQGTLACGKYATASRQQGAVCHRTGILPWFVGIPEVWDTELRLGIAGDPVRFSFISSLSLTSYATNLVLEDSDWGAKTFESISGLDIPKYGSHWIRIMGACDAAFGQCPLRGATGSIIVGAEAPSSAALDAVSAFAVYRYIQNGSVVSETTAPVIFLDQASVRWSAIILETPREQQSQPGATFNSFAVANLSRDPQAVLIRVYDEHGNLSASAKTPILDKALGFGGSTEFNGSGEVLVGGVFADMLSNVLVTILPVSPCTGCTNPAAFRGTVVFEGEKGGLIAPIVFRFNGSALTAVPVKAE